MILKTGLKKGFTIVELAIVLVVIGIILAMAVKGKAMVTTARVMNEMAKLNKFEAAAGIYYTKFGDTPSTLGHGNPGAEGRTSYINKQIFLDMGVLTEKDFEFGLSAMAVTTFGTPLEWMFFLCDRQSTSGLWTTTGIMNSPYVCVGHDIDATHLGHDPAHRYPNAMSVNLICYIEMYKDDDNIKTGHGTASANPSLPDFSKFPEDRYHNCNPNVQDNVMNYLFRVF